MDRNLHNTDTDTATETTPDIKVTGHPDEWLLIAKASSASQGWMKSTKAMICGGGVLVQVTTEHLNDGRVVACAEALQFIPNATIEQDGDGKRIV